MIINLEYLSFDNSDKEECINRYVQDILYICIYKRKEKGEKREKREQD